jgi:hypothetical protein
MVSQMVDYLDSQREDDRVGSPGCRGKNVLLKGMWDSGDRWKGVLDPSEETYSTAM